MDYIVDIDVCNEKLFIKTNCFHFKKNLIHCVHCESPSNYTI